MKCSIVLLLIFAGCAVAPLSAPVGAPTKGQLAEKVRQLTRVIAGLRGVPVRDLKVELAGEEELANVVRQETLALIALPEEATAVMAMLGSVEGFDPQSLGQAPLNVVYDGTKDRLVVKLGTTEPEPRLLFAREIARALLPVPQDKGTFDSVIAARALVRGDAELVMLADAQLQKNESSLPVVAERTRIFMHTQTDDSLIDSTALSHALMSAPRWMRERALFGDVEGFTLAVALYRTQGFSLLDAAHKTPPVSTEQVLHPESYVADDRPIAIADPRTPSGTQLIASAMLGELGFRAVLEQCMPTPRARVAAEGWGGDTFAIAEKADKTRVVAATSTWDTDEDAKEAELALRDVGSCWVKRGSTKTFLVARRGADVAFVSGLAEDVSRTELVALLSLERTRVSPTPPFGQKVLAPPTALPETAADKRGVAKDGLYMNARYGLQLALPPSFSVNTSLAGAELLLRGGRQSASSGVFTASRTEWTTKHQEELFAGVAAMFVQQMGPQAHLTQVKDGPLTILGVTGRERVYTIDTTQVSIRVVLAPLCDKKWMLAFFSSSVVDNDRMALENWVASARLTTDHPPVCNE